MDARFLTTISALLFHSSLIFAFEIQPKKVDAGPVKHGQKIETEITIVNTNEHDITWVGTHSSCGCETLEISKTQIKPGDQARLTIVFNTEGFLGTVSKDVSLLFLDEKSKPVSSKFHIDALVSSSVELDPPVLLFNHENRETRQVTHLKSRKAGILATDVPPYLTIKESKPGEFEVAVDYEKLKDSSKLIHTEKIRFSDPTTKDYFHLMVRIDVHPHPLKDDFPMDLGSVPFRGTKFQEKALSPLTNANNIQVGSIKVYLNNTELKNGEKLIDVSVNIKAKNLRVTLKHPNAEQYGYIRAVIDLIDKSNGDRKYSNLVYAYLRKPDAKMVAIPETTEPELKEQADE